MRMLYQQVVFPQKYLQNKNLIANDGFFRTVLKQIPVIFVSKLNYFESF